MESRNVGDVVLETSRILDELFKAHSRHTEFIPSVFWCLRVLLTEDFLSEECERVVKSSVDRLARIYSTQPLWTQYVIVNELRRLNIPEVAVLLGNVFRSARNDVTVPLRLLLYDIVATAQENELILPSYAMAIGENSSFTLGLAADGPVVDARKVPLEAVKKVSMSNSHTLFLTQKGDVFGCGVASNFGKGDDHGNLIVNPIKIDFPGETLPVVDIAAGPRHSVFITSKSVYVCGMNTNFCLGQKKDKCQCSMKKVKLPLPEGVRRVHFDKVFTNAHCTIVFSYVNAVNEIWIAGVTPLGICEGFTRIERSLEVYEVIRSEPDCLSMFCELEVVNGPVPLVLPLTYVTVCHKGRNLKDSTVALCNSSGILKYTFDPYSGRAPLEPCVMSVSGVLVDLRCVEYHVTTKGDVMLMAYYGSVRQESCTLYRGRVAIIEGKMVEDGFTSVYANESTTTGLHVFLLLQEVQGAHVVSSFACSQDGKNFIYVTNSSTSYRAEQWETADFAKLNEERQSACLDKIHLDFHIYDTNDGRASTFQCIIKSRFPNIDKYVRNTNTLWIEDLSKEVSNTKSEKIFREYLIFNENRVMNQGILTKNTVENVCRVIGVPYSKDGGFYKIGDPLQCLDDFIADRDCILISEEGVEIEFVRDILEMQSSYFGVAFTYHKGDMPRLRLSASESVIRYTLLSIINPNYLRRLQIHEFLELLPFLDQYLLHAVITDALRVIFERVNEFNMSFIFELFGAVPQLRQSIAKYFHNNLHLLTMWRNSAAASVQLIRDVFSCSDFEVSDKMPDNISSGCASLQPPFIHILEDHRKAQWCLFRTEDVVEVLLGAQPRDSSLESALLDYLNKEFQNGHSTEHSSADASMPELVTTIRSRLTERENLKVSKRGRKKSSRQSASEPLVSPSPLKEDLNLREITLSEKNVELDGELQTDSPGNAEHYEANIGDELGGAFCCESRNVSPPDQFGKDKGKAESASPVVRSAWNVPVSSSSPISSSAPLKESLQSSKKRGSSRFTPKGAKFHDASNLLCDTEQGTHFAPWAGVASVQHKPDVISLSEILKEETRVANQSNKTASTSFKEETGRTRTPRNVSWTETNPSTSPVCYPQKLSLAEIMREEEHRLKEGTRRVSRPLHFIEDEERAIEELTQLYRENVGDEVILSVERCVDSCDVMSACSPLWANTPHFRI